MNQKCQKINLYHKLIWPFFVTLIIVKLKLVRSIIMEYLENPEIRLMKK